MKKEDFIVGKWYQCSYWDSNRDYAKCIKVTTNTIYFSEKIHVGKYSKLNDSWFLDMKRTRLVDISEIAEYLPDGHPDKTISYEIY